MRILIDTNVLLRSIEPKHVHYQSSLDAIDLLRSLGHELAIVPQVLYEFWSVATRPLLNNGLGMSPADAHAEVAALQKVFRLLRDERGVFSIWEQLVSSYGVKGKQVHDARLAASIQRHAATYLLTFNTSDFARYSFMTAMSPIDIVAGTIKI
ncbi:MAG: PIN domain-containing protein [Planctomycetaceae bacterium]|nr:PIN domain-containing protein [Planctomycetaceae bacterium]